MIRAVLVLSCSAGIAGAQSLLCPNPPPCAPGSPCYPADFNGDGIIDCADTNTFVGSLIGGSLCADLNGDGQLDFADYLEYLNILQTGSPTCPSPLQCSSPATLTLGSPLFLDVSCVSGSFGPPHQRCPFTASTPAWQIESEVWLKYTATSFGSLSVSTCPAGPASQRTNVDTRMAVYDGAVCPPPPSNLVGCIDNHPAVPGCGSNFAQTTFVTRPGATYLIRIGVAPANTQVCKKISVQANFQPGFRCPGAGFPRTRIYRVVGNSTGAGWSWAVQNSTMTTFNLTAPGVTPPGSPASALAAAFAADINAVAGACGASAMAIGNRFSVTTPGDFPQLWVGASGSNPTCIVRPRLGTTGVTPCIFNPDIEEEEPSGIDCNANGDDDEFDIFLGRTVDLNGNGVPDECDPCPQDLNADGRTDFNDYLEFLNFYNSGSIRVDYNHDQLVDFNDYLEFLNLYNTGC